MTVLALLGLRNKLWWTRLAGVFLASQGLVLVVNFTVGLSLVRLLPMDQYALYTVASSLLALISIGANPGVSHAVITQGSKLAADRQALGCLVNAALSQCRRLYAATLPVLLGVSAALLTPHDWSLPARIAVVGMVAASGWMRVPTMIASAVLNARHDSHGLFRVGMSEGLTRLVMIPLCVVWPYAAFALLANFVGAALARWAGRRQIERLIDPGIPPSPAQTAAIRRFILPLVPIVIYTVLQGQVAVLILGLFGNATAIAEIGAITRFNQIITLGMSLNPFLVQPVLARQLNRKRFINLVGLIITGLATISAIVMASAFAVPSWWLFILGGSYAGLDRELPVALATGMLTLVGGTLYTVVISRNRTAGQYWSIAPSIAGQVAFAELHGIATAFDALVLSLIPALAYAAVQIVLLVRILGDWWPASVATTGGDEIGIRI